MAFLTPVFLFLGLLAGPVILLYMLRLRRREMLVSSTMLWRKLLRDREANAPWQRLRRNLLLLLQLLILFALVLALARPFLPIPLVASGNVVVLLDASASMLATDVSPSRFEAAKAEVNRWIGGLNSGSKMTIIEVGQIPSVLVAAASDHATLSAAVAAARSGPFAPDWDAAFALAAGAAQGYRDAQIVIVSDGGIPEQLPPLPTKPIFLPIGEESENLALSALATRDTESGTQLFASVSNEGFADRTALLSVRIDGTLFDSRNLEIPAGKSASVTWTMPKGSSTVQATIGEQQEDYLSLDDTAWAVHEGGASNRVLIVTEGNLFLEQALSVLPGMESFKVDPAGVATDQVGDEFDLFVYDGVALPDPIPAADLLIINPQTPDAQAAANERLLEVNGTFSDTVAVRIADSPLLQYVDWRNVHIRQAQSVTASWAQPLVIAEGGPLILIGERSGHRIAIISFDLHESDLPLQIAFPILMANISSWLSPGRAFDLPADLQPGSPVVMSPAIHADKLVIVKPDGTTWTAEIGQEAILFTESDQIGFYQVFTETDGRRRAAGSFAVNLFDKRESRINPQSSIRAGQTASEAAVDGDVGQREFWPWLLLAALVVLIIEWWVHHRGTRLPRIGIR